MFAALLLAAAHPTARAAELVDEVDPFIGTTGGGNVYPGPTLPFGFLQPGPDTGVGSSAPGYKHNKHVVGFSQQRISGMGGPIYGQVSLFPMTGEIENPSDITSTGKSAEEALPGYYSVTLAPWDVKTEITTADRTAFYRYTFPKGEAVSRVLVDVGHCLFGTRTGWGSAMPQAGEVKIDPEKREVSGFMVYRGGRSTREPWKVYFAATFDAPFVSYGTWTDGGKLSDDSREALGAEIGAFVNFDTAQQPIVQSKVAISWKSVDQARDYLATQMPGADFDAVRGAAREKWNDVLGKITVQGGTADQRRMFYTALYRMHLMPNDWTGEAPDRYGDRTYYENNLCLWDIFRTVYPMLTLIQPERTVDLVNALLSYYAIDGWTGDAHSAHQYEHIQNGTNADVIIADAYAKKLPGIDWETAYAAIRKNAFVDENPAIEGRPIKGRYKLDAYRQHGYLPSDVPAGTYDHHQSVSRTLEYVHNDFSVLTLARDLGTPEDIADLEKRSLWYKNLWDADSGGFMRGKTRDGQWHEPFDPLKTETGPQYYEGHAWTWSWYVPHDPQGLIELLGDDDAFVEKLSTACENYYQAYNEPCMLQTYLFIHAGRPDQTQYFSRKALAKNFTTATNGLPGNDDSGTTSGWIVWTMLGIYPNAGQDLYYIGSPVFPEATIHLGGGKTFTIRAPDTSTENKFIASATLDGKPWNQAWLRHSDIMAGGTLELKMVAEPTDWGREIRPPSHSLATAAR